SALIRNARLQPHSTLQTAIGIRHQRIQQKSQGFMGGSFNTREFFHKASALVVQRIKQTFLALGFALPAVLLMASLLVEMPGLLLVAVIVQMLGLIAERWYFFAEARHPQNLYYQTVG
ncbi:MAG: DMSO reductase, partial [Candidatus Competibacteraceae bacterium]|nr:DMSO reductase [Candidatus Competibacteraceae bacterium]